MSLAARAAAFFVGMGICGSAFAQFRAVNEVTGTSDGAVASTATSTAMGTNAMATGTDSTAVGEDAVASGTRSTALGFSADATFEDATAVGQNAQARNINATAVGQFADAAGNQSSALGSGSFASGDNSVAIGNSTVAVENSTAVGVAAHAMGLQSTALGRGTNADGLQSMAVGQGADALQDFASAIGANTTADFVNSTALGFGATTTRDDQMMFGTATNTYTMPGITSAASTAAQTGPISVVTTDAAGNLAAATPASLGLASTADFSALQNDINDNTEGVAMSMALTRVPVVLPDSMNYGVSLGYGNFGGENAMAFGGTARVSEAIFINGGAAWGTNSGNGGGAAGITFGW